MDPKSSESPDTEVDAGWDSPSPPAADQPLHGGLTAKPISKPPPRSEWLDSGWDDIPHALGTVISTTGSVTIPFWSADDAANGTEYRCVVSNSFGTVRSNPGILNPIGNSLPQPRRLQ